MLISTKDFLVQESLILTANRRLSRACQQQLEASIQNTRPDLVSWQTPRVMPFVTWLEQTWQCYETETPLLLNAFQEQYLWESIISNDSQISLMNPIHTAQQVSKAWELLTLWNLDLNAITSFDCDEALLFKKWAEEFLERCQTQHWLSSCQLAGRLTHLISSSSAVVLPKHIVVHGFDELAPAYQNLLSSLKQHCNIKQTTDDITTPAAQIKRIELSDTEQELFIMTSWAKEQLQKNPGARIGCIVPELSQLRAQVEHVFNDLKLKNRIHYNLSAAKPLLQYEIIQCAINILELMKPRIALDRIAGLWQSPYLALVEEDFYFGAQLEQKISSTYSRTITLKQLLTLATPLLHDYPGATWGRRLQTLSQLLANAAELQTASAWVETWQNILNSLGWPGSRTLNSEEYQLLSRWQNLLWQFASIDPSHGKLSRAHATHWLTQCVKEVAFQAEQSEAPIEVLGHLEATGLNFDTLWIMGLNSESWPPPAQPNPFLPYALQKKYDMPHATAARELNYTQIVLRRLMTSAQHIIMSSAQQKKDEVLTVSPLIKEVTKINLADLSLPWPIISDNQKQLSLLEILVDHQAPKVDRHEHLSHSSQILKQQAICPFQAFAQQRLHAKASTKSELGISAIERGNLTHEILQRIWLVLNNHATLCRQSDDELKNIIDDSINRSFYKFAGRDGEEINQAMVVLERERLFDLIWRWLEFEKQRPPFTVLQHESERHIQIAGYDFHIKIDRIDELSDGSQIVIDYKTGKSDISKWFGERMAEPQLPLYCVFGHETQSIFSGLTFAQIQTKKISFEGFLSEQSTATQFSECKSISQNKKSPNNRWQEVTLSWKQHLEALAHDFYHGNAIVDPLHQDHCQNCGLQKLCRINQQVEECHDELPQDP